MSKYLGLALGVLLGGCASTTTLTLKNGNTGFTCVTRVRCLAMSTDNNDRCEIVEIENKGTCILTGSGIHDLTMDGFEHE